MKMNIIKATREHEFAYGHRVFNHESKCAHLHGHNGKVKFYCSAPKLDSVGRVIDFSVIKSTLCEWLETNWDHKFLIWHKDPWVQTLIPLDPDGVVAVPFNPTAENLAEYLVKHVGPSVLPPEVTLVKVDFLETGKCGVEVKLPPYKRATAFG
jgi:6-pyruvoyltetrahydropterin/6-carboxytetrahydropterin synthase